MATAEPAPRAQDRHPRRRPFSSWMKRLASLKHPSSDSAPSGTSKRNQPSSYSKNKKGNVVKNNPYAISDKPNVAISIPNSGNGHLSFYTPPSGRSISYVSPTHSKTSLPVSRDGQQPPTISNRSTAPTISTSPDTVSDAAHSKAGTTATVGGAVSSNGVGGGEGSTFSSPAPSVRSMTTTLTTMQSTAPSNLLVGQNNHGGQTALAVPQSSHGHHNSNAQFSHQFPSSPQPASAIPPHLVNLSAGGHPATYNTATANNVLTDNASIMTLASSSKRRRRNSVDTNASVRALAPSSLFGGSRESLPLSVLSSSVNDQSSMSGHHQSRQVSVGLANAERASVYSSSGIAPALPSERNSYYAGKQNIPGDGGSVRSGLVSHGRNDSITKSIGGLASVDSPLASPREAPLQGRISRRNSGWGEVNEEDMDADDNDRSSTGKKLED
ncbi:MAG: hypothetical protein ASARMPRED_007015 [Alectoria sarmentosa]|nr:MAG: hypothetical protein ASARMPRED_007015 [Alectoria sarmentosa]